jgi:hypothetical protein
MNNLERMELLWDYLTDVELFGEHSFIYKDEIDNGEAYLDMEEGCIVLQFEGTPYKIKLEELK